MKKIPDNSILKKEFTIPFFNMQTMRKIFKKRRKKQKIYRKKRKTFAGLSAKNALIALVLTTVFAGGLFNFGKEYIFSKAQQELYDKQLALQVDISKMEYKNEYTPQAFAAKTRYQSYFNIVVDSNGKYQILSKETGNNVGFIRIADKNGNIICSSRMTLHTFMMFSEEEKSYLTCDTENTDIPELRQLEKDYMEMLSEREKNPYISGETKIYFNVEMSMESAYVNRENNTFIPHKAELKLVRAYSRSEEPDEIIVSKEYNIDVEQNDYELVEFDLSGINRERISNGTFPRYMMLGFYGTEKNAFDEMNDKFPVRAMQGISGGMQATSSTARTYYQNTEVFLDGEKHYLTIIYNIDAWNDATKILYFRLVIYFMLAVLTIAFLDAWQKNVRNQADYRFEDYQTNLTNSLAHDLKTPLMAIGGYAENILSGSLSDSETTNYLKSIMDSVVYTDSIITRTLELSKINHMNELHKEKNDIRKIIEQTIEKYSLRLDERNITVKIDGEAEVNANSRLLETAFENLIDNAVKYTSENGIIDIKITSGSLIFSNTVNQKIDVENLKKPFTKGDGARSNQSGSGLGLAISETASLVNGFSLNLSCTESRFTAEIKF